MRRAGQFFFALSFSSLTRRIVSLNLAGLVALVASILYLSQFRAGLIDARAQSLLVQAEIIAVAIAASATVETNTLTIDVDKLLDLKPGESFGVPDEYADFPINPERVAPILRRFKPRFVVMDVHMEKYIQKRYRRAVSGLSYIPVGGDVADISRGDGAQVRERLHTVYGPQSTMTLTPVATGGTRAAISFPTPA